MVNFHQLNSIERCVGGCLFSMAAGVYLWALASVCSDFTLEHGLNSTDGPIWSIFVSLSAGITIGYTARPVIFGTTSTNDATSLTLTMLGIIPFVFSIACAFCATSDEKGLAIMFAVGTVIFSALFAIGLVIETRKENRGHQLIQ